MAAVRLLLDEDVHLLPSETLRERGVDAQHVVELKRNGLSDPEQLACRLGQVRFLVDFREGMFPSALTAGA